MKQFKQQERKTTFDLHHENNINVAFQLGKNLAKNPSNRWLFCLQTSGPYFNINSKFSNLKPSNHLQDKNVNTACEQHITNMYKGDQILGWASNLEPINNKWSAPQI